MNLRLFSNPKVLVGIVVLLIALFVASRTATPQLSPSLQGSWVERLRQSRPLALDEIQPGGATGCVVAADRRQLLLPGGETCTFTITAAASSWLPATRVLSMTLVSGEITGSLVVEMRFDAQPLTVEESLVISQPVGFELPQGGAVLTLPGCTVTDEVLGRCAVQVAAARTPP
jgi:hypothetical protein